MSTMWQSFVTRQQLFDPSLTCTLAPSTPIMAQKQPQYDWSVGCRIVEVDKELIKRNEEERIAAMWDWHRRYVKAEHAKHIRAALVLPAEIEVMGVAYYDYK